MTKATVNKERSIHESASSGRLRRAGMKEALKFTSYAIRPPRTPVQCDRIIRKCNQTIKVMSQLTNKKSYRKGESST